jgi:formate hydrogenlyase subunit 6/NADH:ubiquinone oxidoreductase subunit I
VNEKKHPVFAYHTCIACGICYMSCPVGAISMTNIGADGGKEAFPQAEESCIGCGLCAKSCPIDAIRMELC